MSDDTSDLIAQAIEGLDPGAVVTKFVVVAEVIDSDGGRAVWTDTHDGATRWDTYGLLAYALENEVAHHVAGIQGPDDDDEDHT
jgi:hypothetical protein